MTWMPSCEPWASKSPPESPQREQNSRWGPYNGNQFTVVRPVQRVNVDLTQGMLRALDERAARLNISRQAVIKTLLERALHEGKRTRRPRKSTR